MPAVDDQTDQIIVGALFGATTVRKETETKKSA
jgi:hypothetical protein